MDIITEKKGMRGRVRIITRKAGTDEVLRETPWTSNLIMLGTNTGIDMLLDALAGNYTSPITLGYADIGTGSTAPAISDTTLQTVVARALLAYTAIAGGTLTVQYFFPDASLTNTTYNEFGTFIGGSATVSTGYIFNRVLFSSPYVKSSGEDTTVEVQFDIT